MNKLRTLRFDGFAENHNLVDIEDGQCPSYLAGQIRPKFRRLRIVYNGAWKSNRDCVVPSAAGIRCVCRLWRGQYEVMRCPA
jgi:hypothetical protein